MKQSMKILQIGKFYPIIGGLEKVIYEIMLGVSSRSIRCDMLCAATGDHPPGNMELNTYARLYCVPSWIKLAATMISPAMIIKLREICKDYDILHIHHPDPMACLALFFSGYKGKVILHWHSDILKQRVLLKFFLPFQKWMLRRADLVVGTSPVYIRDSHYLSQVQYKTDYIPIGIDPVVPSQSGVDAIRRKYLGKKIIFSLGRLVEYKGYEYLVRAAQYLDDSYVVVIGGTGPMKSELSKLIHDLDVGHRVYLVGFLPDDELANYFGACDLFCLSSIMKTEAFAIVQLEAMSCRKPVISTNIAGSGVSWVNQHGVSGLIADPKNGESLAETIKSVFKDPAYYEKLSDGALRRYEETFTRKLMIDKCLDLYRQILKV